MIFEKINECHHISGKKHYPVLLNEIISIITPQYGGTFIDCTFGQGGYTKKILEYPKTKVIALDRDIESIKASLNLEKKFRKRFFFKNKKFSHLNELELNNENIKGIIFDLGYSYTQIKDRKKGLSFNSSGNLNMKMGLNKFSAEDVIHNLNKSELEKIFKVFGQESKSNKNSDKRDWYVWADPKESGSPPNNWLSVFGGSSWKWDPKKEQFYLHNFLESQPEPAPYSAAVPLRVQFSCA